MAEEKDGLGSWLKSICLETIYKRTVNNKWLLVNKA
jgi:hypothetical protein